MPSATEHELGKKPRTGPRYQPLVWVTGAVAAGMAADAQIAVLKIQSVSLELLWWSGGGALIAVWFLWWRRDGHKWAMAAILGSLAAVGGAWHHCRWDLFAIDDVGAFAREKSAPVALMAIATGQPRHLPAAEFNPLRAIATGERSRLEIRVLQIRDGETWKPASGRARLEVEGQLLGVRAGDRLRIFAQLAAPRTATSAGQFDFAAHLRSDRIRALVRADFPDCVTVVEPDRGWNPWYWLDRIRGHGDRMLWRHLSHTRSGLAAALLLGVREELAQERTERFMETGTIHILSISGLHVGILAAVLFSGLRFGLFPRRPALWIVALAVGVYALLTDAEAPVIRAAFLVWMVCLALGTHRPVLPFNVLAASALVVLAISPADLFRVGPQLSFLSVAVLSAMGPWVAGWHQQDNLERLIARTRPAPQRAVAWLARWIGRVLAVSAGVWLVTLPLVMAHFHLVSPGAVVLNLLLWLPVACALLAGFGVLLLGWLVPPAAEVCGEICDASLALMNEIVNVAAGLPGSHFWVSGPATWWLIGFYGGLAFWAAGGRRRIARRWALTLLLAWSAAGFATSFADKASNEERLICTFLPVGHGAAVVLELPDGRTLLYDAGQLGSPEAGSRTVAGHLWSRGITHLDAVIISHADVDHFNALPEILRRFSVGVIYVSPMFREDQGAAVRTLLAAVDEAQTRVVEIATGDELDAGPNCRVAVRHPPPLGVVGSDNANSIVATVEYAGRSILLTGDLESPGLDELLADEPYHSDVLMAPHHGSRYSDPPGLAAWSTPHWVIASCGLGDDPSVVQQAYRARGADFLATSDVGSVQVTLTRGTIQVHGWRPPAVGIRHNPKRKF